MPNWRKLIEYIAYVGLLFFVVPIRYEGITEVEVQFQDYLKTFNKTYENSTLYNLRLQAFENSLATIEFLNSNKTSDDSAKYGLTKFSDMHPEEFASHHLLPQMGQRILKRSILTSHDVSSEESHERFRRYINNVPKKVDWRQKNVITKIRNQENCGACWAFSAIETLEAMYAIKTGNLVELSVQQMIDCAETNNGCFGGDICSLLVWMKNNNVNVTTEKEYPLTLRDHKCWKKNVAKGARLEDFACQNLIDLEHVILDLLAKHGPVAVAINAQPWQNYIGGTIQYHCDDSPSQLNHAVQIVGYDLTAKVPFYIVRNTWGEDFGDEGYLQLAIGKNICGLANEVSILKV